MEHIQDGSYVEVIKTGRVGEVISRKRSNVIVSFCDKSLIHPEDLTFKESKLKVIELPKIKRHSCVETLILLKFLMEQI